MIGVGTFRTSARAREYIKQVLDSERLSYGPFLQKFERQFAAAHDCKYAIMTASGTCALQIALAALKTRHNWADGDEVIVPAVTFIATSNIVLQLNMKPVFVDVESEYYGIDPKKIEAAITPRTRCIIPVHLFGMPCEMDSIMTIAKKHNLRVIEDTCETMFAKYQGQSVGSFGDIGCFSTYVAHILVTGVGGLCTTNDPELAVSMRSIMNHGRDSIYISIDDDKNKTDAEKKIIIAKRFLFVQMGYSFRVTELEGALGLAGIEEHEPMMRKRRANGAYFMEALKPLGEQLQLPKIRPGADHSFMMFPIVAKKESKVELVNFLEKHGIETRDMLPLINQPYYKTHLAVKEDDFPVAKWINNNGFYIASHQDLSEAEKKYIVKTLNNYFERKNIEPEQATLIVMSKLLESDFDEVRMQNIIEALPVTEFTDLILADGADNSLLARYFEQQGFRVIQKPVSKSELFNHAIASTKNDNVVIIGIDGTDNFADIDNVLIHLKSGADIVIASRFMMGGKRAPKGFITQRSFGNRFFALIVSLLCGGNVTDTNNLFRGVKRSSLEKLKLSPRGDNIMFEMTVKGLGAGLDIEEFPTQEKPVVFEIKKQTRFLSAFQFVMILIENFFSSGKKR